MRTRNRQSDYLMRRHGVAIESAIPSHGRLAAFTMPQGARPVHQGGDVQHHAATLAAEQAAKRRHAVPVEVRLIYTATGKRTAFAKRTGVL